MVSVEWARYSGSCCYFLRIAVKPALERGCGLAAPGTNLSHGSLPWHGSVAGSQSLGVFAAMTFTGTMEPCRSDENGMSFEQRESRRFM